MCLSRISLTLSPKSILTLDYSVCIYHHFVSQHGFGLPDLYDKNKKASSLGGAGRFDIMSSVVGWDMSGFTPGHLAAYTRQQIGWVKPILIEQDGYYAIQPLEISSHTYRIDHGFPEGEYLLIEAKLPIKWDADVPKGGIVIYHGTSAFCASHTYCREGILASFAHVSPVTCVCLMHLLSFSLFHHTTSASPSASSPLVSSPTHHITSHYITSHHTT